MRWIPIAVGAGKGVKNGREWCCPGFTCPLHEHVCFVCSVEVQNELILSARQLCKAHWAANRMEWGAAPASGVEDVMGIVMGGWMGLLSAQGEMSCWEWKFQK